MSNFTSSWIPYRARRETGNSRAMSQYRNASLVISLFLSCFSCTEEENCGNENITLRVKQLRNREWRLASMYWRHIPTTVVYNLTNDLISYNVAQKSLSNKMLSEVQMCGKRTYKHNRNKTRHEMNTTTGKRKFFLFFVSLWLCLFQESRYVYFTMEMK